MLGAAHVPVGPMRRDELRRAIVAAGPARGPARGRRARRRARRRRRGRAGRRSRSSRPRCSSCGSSATARASLTRPTSRAGGVRGAVARLAERVYGDLMPDEQPVARSILERLAGRRRRGPGRAPAAAAGRARAHAAGDGGPRQARGRTAREPSARTRPRSPTRRCCASGPGYASGSRRTPRAGACTTTSASRRASGTRAGATPASSTAAPGSPPRSTGRPPTTRARRPRARLPRREQGGAATRSQRRLRAVLAGVGALLVLAVVAGLVALQQRGSGARRGDRRRRPAARLARAHRERPRPLAAARTPGRRPRRPPADPRQPARGAQQEPGRDRRAARRQGGLHRARPEPGRAHAGCGRRHRQPLPLQHPHAAPRAGAVRARGRVADRHARLRPRRPPARHRARHQRRGRGHGDGHAHPAPGPGASLYDFDRQVTGLSLEGDTVDVASRPDPTETSLSASLAERLDTRQRAADPRPGHARTTPELAAARHDRAAGRCSRSRTGRLVIRDAATLKPVARVAAGTLHRSVIALSPDDRTVALGGQNGSVRFLDLRNGRQRTASGRHSGPVTAARFTSDGRSLVSASEDGTAILWDVGAGAASETLQGHANGIAALQISPDGRTLYTAGVDGAILIWDLDGTRRLGRPFDAGPANGAARRAERGRPAAALGHANGTLTAIDLSRPTVRPDVRRRPRRRRGRRHPLRAGQPARGRPRTGQAHRARRHRQRARRAHDRPPAPGEAGSPTRTTPGVSADGSLLAVPRDVGSNVIYVGLWRLPSGRPVGAGWSSTGRSTTCS